MKKAYRALISIPITASSDKAARKQAEAHAWSLRDSHGHVLGQLELVGEVRLDTDIMEIIRVVHPEPHFLSQLPPDWKP
jgi:hypothetical protein